MPRTPLRFNDTIEKTGIGNILRDKKTVIIALSGGADSSCLFYLMTEWCKKNGVAPVCAHVNHMIRGHEADSDEAYCRKLCEKFGVKLFVKKLDVPQFAEKSKLGLEEAARIIRYSFFDEVSLTLSGDNSLLPVATAHNAGDNLETVIFNMLRGSGTHGLCGISPIRDNRYVRPLIYDSPENIRDFCRNQNIGYCVDKTNADTEYTRNHIRHNIVPSFMKICPDPYSSVSKLTELIKRDDDYLDKCASDVLKQRSTCIDRMLLSSLDKALASRVLIKLYNNAKKTSSTIEEIHVEEILRFISQNKVSSKLSLPGEVTFILDRKNASFVYKNDALSPVFSFEYPGDGNVFENELCKIEFLHDLQKNDKSFLQNIYKLSIHKTFCFDKINGALKIRQRLPGDVIKFGGMTRKLKALFNEKKLSEKERLLLPVIYDDTGILWIPGFPPREGVSLSNENQDDVLDTITVKCTFFAENNLLKHL